MRRREFIASSLAAGALSFHPVRSEAMPTAGAGQEFIEWIKYNQLIGPKKQKLMDFFKAALIPAYNRAGIKNVGVFTVRYGPNNPSVYLLVPHPTLESVITTPNKLLEDAEFLKAGAAVLDTPIADPAFYRIESSLMLAFSHMPKVEPASNMLSNNNRVYEMRIYESHNHQMAKRKIHMFNEGGEIAIFRKTGLQPVFFGETVIGPLMPNLTYMVVFESMEARDKNWEVFRKDPDWIKLRDNTFYSDTVSNITDIILSPAPFSQV